MHTDKPKSSFRILDIVLLVFSLSLTAIGVIALNVFGQLSYLLITAGLFILFFNIWRLVKKQIKAGAGSRSYSTLLVINVFALALSLGILFGYFLMGFIG